MKNNEQEPSNVETPRCQFRTEVYSRVCGFFRPVQQWNRGKREEFKERKPYQIKKDN